MQRIDRGLAIWVARNARLRLYGLVAHLYAYAAQCRLWLAVWQAIACTIGAYAIGRASQCRAPVRLPLAMPQSKSLAGLGRGLCVRYVAQLARGYACVAERICKPCAPRVVSDAIAALSFPHDHALMPCMRCHCRCYVYRLPFDHCPNPLIASDASGLGVCFPRSQRDTVMPVTPSLSARLSCVRPSAKRALRSCSPVMALHPISGWALALQ